MYRYRVGVIYLKLGGLVIAVGGPGGQQVKKHLQQVHVLSSNIGDLKDGTHPGGTQHRHTGYKGAFSLTRVLIEAGPDLIPL